MEMPDYIVEGAELETFRGEPVVVERITRQPSLGRSGLIIIRDENGNKREVYHGVVQPRSS